MADLVSAGRVWETSTGTGAGGTYNLAGHPTNKQLRTFVEADLHNGHSFVFEGHQSVDDQWQISRISVTNASPNTYTVERVVASSNAGAQVSWSAGARNIFVVDLHGYSPGPQHTITDDLTLDETYLEVIGNFSTLKTVTLPPVAAYQGKWYWFKSIGTATMKIAEDAGDSSTLEGPSGTFGTAINLTTAGQWLQLRSDGTKWRRTGAHGMSITGEVVAGTAGSILYVDTNGDLAQDNSNLSYDATAKSLRLGNFNTADSNIRTGSVEINSFALGNAYITDNAYHDGTSWKYRATGRAGIFYLFNREAQIRMFDTGTAGDPLPSDDFSAGGRSQLKAHFDGTVAIGGIMNSVNGDYTHASMLVNSSGDVIVGAVTGSAKLTVSNRIANLPTAPQEALHIIGADSTQTGLSIDTFAEVPTIIGRRAQGTAASPSAIDAAGRTLLAINSSGYGATAYGGHEEGIAIQSDEVWDDGSQGTRILFYTTINGGLTAVERVRINNAGYMGIGTTGLGSISHKLQLEANPNETPDDALAIAITNNANASLGSQSYSPSLIWRGEAWETTGGSSDAVTFRQYLQTVQGAAASGNLLLEASIDGGAYSTLWYFSTGGGFYLAEQAAANTDAAGFGQIWVKTATPNELWFTDDEGNDFQLSNVGGGNVSNTGTPLDNQLAVWTAATTIEGDPHLTFTDSSDFQIHEDVNDGNPQFRLGASDAEELHLQAVYDGGAQTLDYILFQTDVASATANKGLYRFNVDGTDILDIDDGGIDLDTGMALSINGTDVLDATTLGSGVTASSLTSVGTITSGTWQGTTIAVNQGGTGQTSYTDGQLLIGNTTGNTLAVATLTGGTGITVTNGSGTITIDADNNGDVVGPASAVDNEIVRFDSTTGKLVQSSGANATTTLSDNADLTLYDATNDGNPEFRLGAADAEELHLQAVYDGAAQTLDYILFQTDVASATANKGLFRFNVDGTNILDIDDGGIDLDTGMALSINGTDVLDATTLGSGVTASSLTSVGTITSGTWNGTTIGIANGGTGQTTQTAAFDALAPTTTKGDIVVFNGTDNIRLAVGADTQVLTADSAEASGVKWAAAGGGSPGGSDTEVQYNNGGAFGGMLGFAWDDVANELTITAQATDDTPLTIKAQASSTAALFETQNSTGGVHLEVKESTMLFRRNSADTNEAFEITSDGVFLRAENGSGGTHLNCSGTGNNKQFVCSGGSALAGVTCGNVNGGGAGWLFIFDPDIHANPSSPWSQAINLGVDTNTRDVVLGPTRDASAASFIGRLRSVNGFGTDNPGGNLQLAAGAATGDAAGGNIVFQTSDAGSPGTTTQTLTTKTTITRLGNILHGTTTAPTANATKCMFFGDNGATNPTPGANTAGLFAKDVAGTVELHAIDSAANATPISPHDSLTGEWIFFSENIHTGRKVRVRMEEFFKRIAEKFPEEFAELISIPEMN